MREPSEAAANRRAADAPYQFPQRGPRIMNPGQLEPDSVKYIMFAHGVTTREKSQTITIPENLRVVFFYDPRRADTLMMVCPDWTKSMKSICSDAQKKTRWVYGPGTYIFRSFFLGFSENDSEAPHSFGVYKCEGDADPTYEKIHREFDVSLEDAIPLVLYPNPTPTVPTTLYILACGAKESSRIPPKLSYIPPGSEPNGGRKTRRSKRTKRRGTRHARVR
jgi:hypothetical protein